MTTSTLTLTLTSWSTCTSLFHSFHRTSHCIFTISDLPFSCFELYYMLLHIRDLWLCDLCPFHLKCCPMLHVARATFTRTINDIALNIACVTFISVITCLLRWVADAGILQSELIIYSRLPSAWSNKCKRVLSLYCFLILGLYQRVLQLFLLALFYSPAVPLFFSS